MTVSVPAFNRLGLNAARIADLRSDHAGEHGAVAIYCGVLAVSRDGEVRRFARRHLRTELHHRRFFLRWLPKAYHSRLLPLWWAAGWTLGALSAVFGARGVFRTIAAVETFVEQHYRAQIEILDSQAESRPLAAKLRKFCEDEVEHQRDAARRFQVRNTQLTRLWEWTVGLGSSLGVAVARRV